MASWIYAIFFLSGISGLIYQVIWVREFGQIFGNTVTSASLITGIFVLGLGIGSYFAGKKVDHEYHTKPTLGLKYYAITELWIALLGFIVSVLIPRIESLSSFISTYQLAENGWLSLSLSSYILRALVAFLLLLPITVLMGATLTFLIRYLMAFSLEHAGWKVGLLYGLNTLGAAFGCALVDIWAIPTIGLMSTKLFAVAINLFAGLAALSLLKKNKNNLSVPPRIVEEEKNHNRPIWPAGLAIALSGFCAMGTEIVWFRFLNSLFSGRRMAFSLTLVIILTGMWLGSLLSGFISKKSKNPEWLYVLSQLLFVVLTLGGFWIFVSTGRKFFTQELFGAAGAQDSLSYFFIEQLNYIIPGLKILFVPAVAMGAAYPLINDLIQKNSSQVGRRAGVVYLWNSIGAIFGSVMTGFVLLPLFGMQDTVTLLSVMAFFASVPIIVAYGYQTFTKSKFYLKSGIVITFLLSVSSFFYWFNQPEHWLVKNGYIEDHISSVNRKILKVSEGVNETAMVIRAPNGDQFLYTNGHSMSGSDYTSQRYMRAFAHIPLLQLKNPETALVICFGVGNTSHAVSLHPELKKIDVVDISANVLGLANYFESNNLNVLQDPRVQVNVNDGRQHLRMQKDNTYDLITLEPPPLVSAGVASLYSKNFYELAQQKMKSGGYITQWLPIYQIDGAHARQLIKSFLEVFPNAVLLSGFGRELILMGQKDGPNQLDWKSLQTRIDTHPKIKEDLKRINLSSPIEILGTFLAGSQWLKKNLIEVESMTDDIPIIEYNHYIVLTELPKELFWVGSIAEWCPSCFNEQQQLHPELPLLDSYLSLMQAIYLSPPFTKIGEITSTLTGVNIPFGGPLPVATKENFVRTIDRKAYNKLVDSYGAVTKMFGPTHVAE